MHCHQSIRRRGKPVFARQQVFRLSETCLEYIAGIIKHAIKALNNGTEAMTIAGRSVAHALHDTYSCAVVS